MKTVVKNSKNTIGNLEKMDCKIESAIETLEVMSNPETLKRYKKRLQNIKEGCTSTFDDFVNKHDYDIAIHTI